MMKSVLVSLLFVISAAAHADTYKIDTKESTASWKGMKKVGSSHNGAISIKDGQVEVDKKGAVTGGVINIDMKTITNEDLKTNPEYQAKLVGHLSSEDFFNAAKYPTSTFKITSVTPKGKDEVTVKGDLTMIGTTHPVEFPAKVTTGKNMMTGEGTMKVDRTKWGLKYGSGNFFKELAADKIISDEFEISFKIVAKK